MKTKFSALISLLFLATTVAFSQIAITPNGTPPHPSAMLEVQSTNMGLLFPRMSLMQRNAIVNPAPGLVVFDTTRQALYIYNGFAWKQLSLTDPATLPVVGIDATDGTGDDRLGVNVAIFNNYAAAGADYADINGKANQGSVYVYKFENNNWRFSQKLVANDGAAGDNFGRFVTFDSIWMIVGSRMSDVGTNADQGAAYVYKLENGTWVQKQKLISADGGPGDHFGYYISIKNGLAVISSVQDDFGSIIDQGSAYIFKLDAATNTWVQVKKIFAADGTAGDFFGSAVMMDSGRIVASAGYDDVNGNYHQGSVYTFNFLNNNWVQTSKLVAFDGAYDDNYGNDISTQGDYLLVGAMQDNVNAYSNQGAAYLYKFENGTWAFKQKVVASDFAAEAHFGASVSLKDNYAIIGAHGQNANGGNAFQGSAYVFQLNTATNSLAQKQKITNPDPTGQDCFGFSTRIDNLNVIIGALCKGSYRGKIYFKSIE